MEKLAKTQRESIFKMSSERLRRQLVGFGVEEEKVQGMDRNALLQAYTDLLAAETLLPVAEVGGLSYDPDVERERLALQRQQLELEIKKHDDEMKKHDEEMYFKRAELQMQEQRNVEEKERAECQAVKLKRYGDALRNALTKQSNDALDTVAFFRNAEVLFHEVKVPAELRGILIRPFLNERSKTLVARLAPECAARYDEIKALILKEYKMSPATYKEKFNTLVKDDNETYGMYGSRLQALIDGYLESRHVTRFDDLRNLLLCDRVKAVLSEATLKYILSVESKTDKGWLTLDELTKAIDTYVANYIGEKPRAGALGVVNATPPKLKAFKNFSSQNPPDKIINTPEQHFEGWKSSKVYSGCFKCGSKEHRKSQCGLIQSVTNKPNYAMRAGTSYHGHRANRCTVEPRVFVNSALSADSGLVQGCKTPATPVLGPRATEAGQSAGQTSDSDTANRPAAQTDPVTECIPTVGHVTVETTDVNINNVCLARDLAKVSMNDVAKLNYIDIGIASSADEQVVPVSCLDDSGSELCVINSIVLERLDDVEKLGTVKIRGIVGQPVDCALVRIYVCLLDDMYGHRPKIPIICAVTDAANEKMILPHELIVCLQNACENGNVSPDVVDAENRSESVLLNEDERETIEHVNVVTRSGKSTVPVNNQVTNEKASENISEEIMNADELFDCAPKDNQSKAIRDQLIVEQQNDPTLHQCFSLARRGKGNYYLQNGVLMHKEKILGQDSSRLVVPDCRRGKVLELGHDKAGHMSFKKTLYRIRLSFTWPEMRKQIIRYVKSCDVCQKRVRVTCWDRVPITPIERDETAFSHWFMDIGGPLTSEKQQYNYFLIMVDCMSRFAVAYALRTVTARSICECLLNCWSWLGVPTTVTCDNASYNVATLTQEVMKRFGCSPRFITVGHKEANGLAERYIGTVKSLIAKAAIEYPKSWHKHLAFIMWSLREVPNDTTGVPPWLLALGTLPRGPLAVLKESWCGDRDVPSSFGKDPTKYLQELHEKLQVAQKYADTHAKLAQRIYAERYNRRAKEKQFCVGDKVLILQPDTTRSRVFSRWKGPAIIVEVKSPSSYVVDLHGNKHRMHVNQLRHYNVRADEVTYDTRAFGQQISPSNISVKVTQVEDAQDLDDFGDLYEDNERNIFHTVSTCAIIHNEDLDFGPIHPFELHKNGGSDVTQTCENLPSQRINPESVSHLSDTERAQLFAILDKYSDVFRDKPGLCTEFRHEIPVTADFRPKRLQGYRIPEKLKPDVEQQINEMLEQGIIRRSNSPMASPLVCVLKNGGKDGVRLVCDFRYVNSFSVSDAYPIADIQDIVQRIGRSRYLTITDLSSGYWQTEILEKDRWKTAFIYGNELYEWNRTAFGLKNSGCTFCRNLQFVLKPIKHFAEAYVDDSVVHSMEWFQHLEDLDKYLETIRLAGLTLKLKKCKFGLPEVKFCGLLVGSGSRRADPEKITAIKQLVMPVTKKQVRQVLGFFSYFRESIPKFAELAKPLTDLTVKTVSNKVPWGIKEQEAYDKLKNALCKATENKLAIIDLNKPFHLHVDASQHTVSGALMQVGEDEIEHPIAFFSQKLNATQRNWAVIEKEAYAALTAVRRYYNWVFGAKLVIISDHNPITYLTETAPKSSKLMRWSLALQDMNVEFKYRVGKEHVVPDTLTRFGPV